MIFPESVHKIHCSSTSPQGPKTEDLTKRSRPISGLARGGGFRRLLRRQADRHGGYAMVCLVATKFFRMTKTYKNHHGDSHGGISNNLMLYLEIKMKKVGK